MRPATESKALLSVRIPMCERQTKLHVGLDEIPRYAMALSVHGPLSTLGLRETFWARLKKS